MQHLKFPKLDWTKRPALDLLGSRETRPLVLRLPLTEEPEEDWSKHFKEALAKSPFAMDVSWDLEGDILVIWCSAPLDYDLPRFVESVLQNANIEWSNERDAEEQWTAARKREFDDLKTYWDEKRKNQS